MSNQKERDARSTIEAHGAALAARGVVCFGRADVDALYAAGRNLLAALDASRAETAAATRRAEVAEARAVALTKAAEQAVTALAWYAEEASKAQMLHDNGQASIEPLAALRSALGATVDGEGS